MSTVTPLRPNQEPSMCVIQRDPGWCLMHLSSALEALEDLTKLEGLCPQEEQLNLLQRENLSGLFAVLHDYCEAARSALPEV